MDINKQIAIKGAELLGWILEPCDQTLMWFDIETNTYICEYDNFDPANNANDMNKLIEAFKISVYWWSADKEWGCQLFDEDEEVLLCETVDESRDEAVTKCIIKALGVDNE